MLVVSRVAKQNLWKLLYLPSYTPRTHIPTRIVGPIHIRLTFSCRKVYFAWLLKCWCILSLWLHIVFTHYALKFSWLSISCKTPKIFRRNFETKVSVYNLKWCYTVDFLRGNFGGIQRHDVVTAWLHDARGLISYLIASTYRHTNVFITETEKVFVNFDLLSIARMQ